MKHVSASRAPLMVPDDFVTISASLCWPENFDMEDCCFKDYFPG